MLLVNEKISQYLNHLLVERGASTNTLKAYERDLRRYEKYLEEIKCLEITPQVIFDHVSHLRKSQLSEPSIARAVVALRNFHQFVSKESGVADPTLEVEVPKIPKRLPKALSINEVTSLIESCAHEGNGIRDRAMIELLYASGARVSELIKLDIDDVAEVSLAEKKTMTIKVRGKGGKERFIPVGSFAQAALSQYLVRIRPILLAHSRERALFLNSHGGRLTRQSAWNIVVEAAERSGLAGKVSPHSLRHSFATHLLDGGADVRVVQELLGHASVTTTQIYTLITIDKLRESYATAHPRSR